MRQDTAPTVRDVGGRQTPRRRTDMVLILFIEMDDGKISCLDPPFDSISYLSEGKSSGFWIETSDDMLGTEVRSMHISNSSEHSSTTSYELVCICIIIMNIMHTTTRTSYIIIMHNIMDSIYVFMCIICILCIEYPYKSTRLPYYAYYPYSIRSTSRVILGKGTVCIQLNNTSYSSSSRSITMPRCCTLS